jgi:hypothetical protein
VFCVLKVDKKLSMPEGKVKNLLGTFWRHFKSTDFLRQFRFDKNLKTVTNKAIIEIRRKACF